MKHRQRTVSRSKRISLLLEKLGSGIVIVEGKHDVAKLGRFGIRAISERSIGKRLSGKKVYLFTDRDRSGDVKKERAISLLYEAGAKVDTNTGMTLLKALNVTSVEQVVGPIEEVFEKGNK